MKRLLTVHALLFAISALIIAAWLNDDGWVRHIDGSSFVFANVVFVLGESACATMLAGRIMMLVPATRNWLLE